MAIPVADPYNVGGNAGATNGKDTLNIGDKNMTLENPKVTFRYQLGEHDINGPVLNPGEDSGNVWLLTVGVGYSSLFYAIEADYDHTAIDILADDDTYGHIIRIDDDTIDDYGDDIHYSDCGHPIDLDNVHIDKISSGLRYYSAYLPDKGVLPKSYGVMESAGLFDELWGPQLQIAPDNHNRYVELRYPVELPNVKDYSGYVRKTVSYGDIVTYGAHIGRALGILISNGQLLVLETNCRIAYVRSVKLDDIESVVPVSNFTQWFFSKPLSDSQTLMSYHRHGSLSESYIGKYLDDSGQLRKVVPPFHYKAIEANSR